LVIAFDNQRLAERLSFLGLPSLLAKISILHDNQSAISDILFFYVRKNKFRLNIFFAAIF